MQTLSTCMIWQKDTCPTAYEPSHHAASLHPSLSYTMVYQMGTKMYSADMALTIKNPETIALTQELARRTGQTQTAAITQAVRQALAVPTKDSMEAKQRRVDRILQEIWADMTPEKSRLIRQDMEDLYDEQGLPR